MIIKVTNPALPAICAKENPQQPEGIFKKLATGKIASLFKVEEPSLINQTMKVKMRELSLNERYAQEAVAIAQTAVEGLDKIQGNLEKMQQLVSMASEDIYTDEDREEFQKEIGKLNRNIDDIVDDTTYKGHKLLSKDDAESQENSEENDIVKDILQKFDEQFSRKNFTAEAMGTDKVDVSSAENAKNSMAIVNEALKSVKDEIVKWQKFEIKNARYFELTAPEEASSLISKPTMVVGALELAKYNLLNTDSRILLDNSSKDPDRVANLIK